MSSNSTKEITSSKTSRIVLATPETTNFALHTVKEYSEFGNVFKSTNTKKNVTNFHAFITDLGKHYNSKNTPMREMAEKKLTKIEATNTIRNTFGIDIGVKIVNAVRDLIVLQIPKIVSK